MALHFHEIALAKERQAALVKVTDELQVWLVNHVPDRIGAIIQQGWLKQA